MGFIRSSCLFLVLIMMAIPAEAEIYQSGRGILLPSRRNPDNEKSMQITPKSNSGVTVIQKGQVVPQQAPSPVIIGGKPSNQDPDKNAQLTTAYANHLFTSVCAQEYREALAPKSEKNLNMKKMWADVQASCKCLSNQVLTVVPATDFADYVMYSYGPQDSKKPDPEFSAYVQTGKADQISDLVQNGELRKKCGFLK